MSARWEHIQKEMNQFTRPESGWLDGVVSIRVDGEKGPSTNKRVLYCKYYLGYVKSRRDDKSDTMVGEEFLWRLNHPTKVHPKFQDKEAVERGHDRRVKQRKTHREHPPDKDGLTTLKNGVVIVSWMVPHVTFAWDHKWQGWVVSGWRSPEHSEDLCEAMCGAPSCPGRCAGRSSNHTRKGKPNGALDVTFYDQFGQLMRRSDAPTPRIFNDLPADRVHYSASGH
jgi:hypothetical protein